MKTSCGYTDLILIKGKILCSKCGKEIDEENSFFDFRDTRDRLERGLKPIWPKQ